MPRRRRSSRGKSDWVMLALGLACAGLLFSAIFIGVLGFNFGSGKSAPTPTPTFTPYPTATPTPRPTPISSNQIYWGAWDGEDCISQLSTIQALEAKVGKNLSIWNNMQWWYNVGVGVDGTDFNLAWMNAARNNGMIPMVSWCPNNQANSSFVNLNSILDGSWDSYLTAWGQASAAWGHPYFVRLMWEFNGAWVIPEGIYPYGSSASGTVSAGNTPQKFVEAWQYIVSHVRAAEGGKDYITWVWCPADIGDSVATLQSLYPGNNYVDWVGTDIYGNLNQGDVELTNIHTAIPQKTVMIPEIGYTGSDSNYWNTLLSSTLPNQYPWVKAVLIWEMPSGGLTVVSPSATLSAFRQGISSSYYSSNVFSSLSTSPIPVLKVP